MGLIAATNLYREEGRIFTTNRLETSLAKHEQTRTKSLRVGSCYRFRKIVNY